MQSIQGTLYYEMMLGFVLSSSRAYAECKFLFTIKVMGVVQVFYSWMDYIARVNQWGNAIIL